VEAYYFWPDIAADLAEVRRVKKPSGQLVIIAGMYRGSRFDKRNMGLIRAGGLRCFAVQAFDRGDFQPRSWNSRPKAAATYKATCSFWII